MAILSVKNISKSFESPNGSNHILSSINFSVTKGEIIGIRGGNGSGKTTLFNIITGLLHPTEGSIKFENQINKTKIGVVFQNYNSTLLPWLNIEDNITIPLKLEGLIKTERLKKLNKVIDKLNFNSLPLKSYPHQLSGGQKQKVVIARALIQDPDILILDEPFSNLDFQTSWDLQLVLQNLHSESNITILLVSHIIDHILFLTDRVLVLGNIPSTIIKEFPINIKRPRNKECLVSDEFELLRNKVLEFEYNSLVR